MLDRRSKIERVVQDTAFRYFYNFRVYTRLLSKLIMTLKKLSESQRTTSKALVSSDFDVISIQRTVSQAIRALYSKVGTKMFGKFENPSS